MGFIAAYKRLEKLCGEVMNDERRVSAYIDEMYRLTNGRLYVRSWDEDLKNLKHYRWLRNQIAHEPECTEQNMCTPADEQWAIEFYSRIIEGTDPLTLYRKATGLCSKGRKDNSAKADTYYPTRKNKARFLVGLLLFLILFTAMIFLCIYIAR